MRHAEKQQGSEADPRDPELTDEGQARAQALAQQLSQIQLSLVISSPYRRTRQTAQPTAERHGLSVIEISPVDLETIVAQIDRASGDVLIVGHSNTVPELLAKLGVTETVAIADSEYGDLFVVTVKDGRVRAQRGHFGP